MGGKCWRLVNDQDGVPQITLRDAFVHVGTEVFMNEVGLWVQDGMHGDHIADDGEGEGMFDEIFEDHKVHNYMRLLDFFQVMVDTKDYIHDVQDKLKQCWVAYNAPATEFQMAPAPPKWGHKGKRWTAILQIVPNITRLIQCLEDNFSVKEEHGELLDAEIQRLCQYYKKTDFGFPILALACCLLYLREEAAQSMECLRQAVLFKSFCTHDHDGDGFLSMLEFRELLFEVVDDDVHEDVKKAIDDNIGKQWRQLDRDEDGSVSFTEYFIWRHLGEAKQLFSPLSFKDLKQLKNLESRAERLSKLNKAPSVTWPTPTGSPKVSSVSGTPGT